jgi:hypothetical protein
MCRLGFLKPLLPGPNLRIGTSIFILSLDSLGSNPNAVFAIYVGYAAD